MNLISVSAFQDNYIWLLDDQQQHCVIVDPGDAQPVIEKFQQMQSVPTAILLTHHHADHVGGVAQLIAHFGPLPVYGPQETADKGTTIVVHGGDTVQLGEYSYQVIDVPGHTSGHIAYYLAPYLFCGDTLFSAGCGRLFEGTAEQMYHSLQRLSSLPDDTLVCCAHEYTLSNLTFSLAILPDDVALIAYRQQVEQWRAQQLSSVPTILAQERKINLFLRCNDNALQKNLGFSDPMTAPVTVFTELRQRKDRF